MGEIQRRIQLVDSCIRKCPLSSIISKRTPVSNLFLTWLETIFFKQHPEVFYDSEIWWLFSVVWKQRGYCIAICHQRPTSDTKPVSRTQLALADCTLYNNINFKHSLDWLSKVTKKCCWQPRLFLFLNSSSGARTGVGLNCVLLLLGEDCRSTNYR